ncbi:MAG TPA: hypothetical protein DCM86_09970 [Verrucomicrobiales bacterium]|nr:hypothetical protein [Verrucomicrobiales bacterium]
MKKILIIEDDVIVSSVYKNLLEGKGFSVMVATDGQTGYYQMTEFRPDAVLLDLMLPKMNGVEILRKIRAQRQFQAIPVLVFTNAYVPNMVEVATQAGANFVFSKSTLTSRQLLEAICQCLAGFSTSHLPALPGPGNQVTPPMVIVPGVAAPVAARHENLGADAPFHPDPASAPPPIPGFPAPAAPPPVPQASPAPGRWNITAFPPPPAAASFPPASATPPTPAPVSVAPPPLAPPPAELLQLPPNILPLEGADDARVQQELKTDFFHRVDPTLVGLRFHLGELVKASTDAGKTASLLELHRQVRSLATNAALAGFHPVADLASAFEVLLSELAEKPKHLTGSSQRTIANTMDCLTELLVRKVEENVLENPPPAILVVDDEVLSRRAVTFALEKGRMKATAIESPHEALRLATSQPYDLIFLDVQMPGLNGFDLCTQIRAQSINQHTPVIFVTSQSDFTSRARSTLSGATDLIAKPFMFIELTVKAISTLLQNRVIRPQNPAAAARRAA